MKTVELYTAGISINHYREGSGDSGYGVLIVDNGQKTQLSQSFRQSTNNRMQMIACIEGLKTLKEPCIVKIYLTSEYIVNSINYDWVSKWREKAWKNSEGDKIQNVDLWIQLLNLLAQHSVEFIWIRKNTKNPNIEFCNEIANRAIKNKEAIIDIEEDTEKNHIEKISDVSLTQKHEDKGETIKTEKNHTDGIEIDGVKLDITNEEFNNAVDFVQHTNKLVYLTGKAGTGKTTFLKYIKKIISKNMVVLAPTGVAAINAGGQTIHSFFKIPPSVYVPNDRRLRTKYHQTDTNKSTIYDNFQYNNEKLAIIRGLEILIIDEISMVRCDLLDVVDRLLRVFRKKENEPFGGVQVILIGDTFQLPPVAKYPEWEILKQFYENPFFFSSFVIKENQPVYIELKKIYRQKEQDFIDLLNKVRVNRITQIEINQLNAKFNPTFTPPKNENYIILATHNIIVNRTNLTKLEELPSELKIFEATVTGDFPENIMPTDRELHLKENAQIMFIKNDTSKRYFNGKIAKIIRIDDDGIIAEWSEEHQIKQIFVEREEWKNIKYTWNEKEKKIEEETIGTFIQYPVKLAWAITVHKSQGLTFEKVIADLGSAFDAGQVYVALSRCTTFNGLVLKTQLNRNAIKTAPEVLDFAQNEMPSTLVVQELNSGKADFYYKKLRDALKQFQFEEAYDNFVSAIKYRNDIESDIFKRYFVLFGLKISSYKEKNNFNKKNDDEINLQKTDLEEKIQELKENLLEKTNKITEQNNAVKLLLDRIKEFENIIENNNDTIENQQVDLDDKIEIIEQLDNSNEKLGQNLKMALSKINNYKIQIDFLNQEIDRLNELKWYHKLAGKK